jgi:hypothetical protein
MEGTDMKTKTHARRLRFALSALATLLGGTAAIVSSPNKVAACWTEVPACYEVGDCWTQYTGVLPQPASAGT